MCSTFRNQVNALAIGTKNLADNGDSNAKAIIDRMSKLGITVKMPPPPAARLPAMLPLPQATIRVVQALWPHRRRPLRRQKPRQNRSLATARTWFGEI